MVVIRGADEPVVGDVHQLPQVLDAPVALHDVVHEFLGGDAGLLGLGLDLLAVLVRAGEEHDVLALQPVVAGQGVRGHGAVGVADVELVRRIVDGRGDIELFLFHRVFSFFTAAPNGRGLVLNARFLYYIRRLPKLQCFVAFFPDRPETGDFSTEHCFSVENRLQ